MNQWIEQMQINSNNGQKSIGKLKYFHVHNGHEHPATLKSLNKGQEYILKLGCYCPFVKIICDVCGVIKKENDQVIVERI